MIKRKYSIFISYRREGGSEIARNVLYALEKRGYSVFMDVEDLKTGPFDTALLKTIESAKDFIIILSENSLDRCASPTDWVRIEIRHALKTEKNIVPIMTGRFTWPPLHEIPDDIRPIARMNGLPPTHEYFEESMDKLCGLLKSTPFKPIPLAKWALVAIAAALLAAVGLLFAKSHDDTQDIYKETTPVQTRPVNYQPSRQSAQPSRHDALVQRAENGDVQAMVDVGRDYDLGTGVPRSSYQAVKWFDMAAKKDNDKAIEFLAWKTWHGDGIQKNTSEAIHLYERGIKLGNVACMTWLGHILEAGDGTPQDLKRAVELFTAASDKGDSLATAFLGYRYLAGGGGLQPNPTTAVRLYKSSADKGNSLGMAQYGWSLWHKVGGLQSDPADAVVLIQKSASQNDSVGLLYLGELYEAGMPNLPQSDSRAADAYQKSVDLGCPQAMGRLAWMEANGKGRPKDVSQAIKLARQGAALGDVGCTRLLSGLGDTQRSN